MEVAQRQSKVIEVVKELGAELNSGKVPTVSMSTHLEWDLGLASVERTELLVRLEKALGETLSSNAVFNAVTVSDLVALLPGSAAGSSTERLDLKAGEIPPYPTHANSLIEALEYQALHQPTRKTLFFQDEGECVAEWSYADLQREAGRRAAGLAAHGVVKGDRVGIMLPTSSDYVATFYAVLWLGAIPVPLYPPFRLDQLEDYVKRQSAILSVAGVKLLVSFDRAKAVLPLLKMNASQLRTVVTVNELDGEPVPSTPGEMGLIQFTSGSTGLPKGVTLTQQALLHNIRAYGYGMELGKDDVTISWLPLYHDMGLIGTMLGSIYHGQPLVLMGPQDFLARPSRWLWAVHKYRGTVSPAPNFAYEICARKIPDSVLEGLDLSSWRIALNGAEAVREETLERFTQRFEPYGFANEAHFPAYGLAEATLAVTFSPPGRGPLVDKIHRERLETDGVVASCGPNDPSLHLVACGRTLPEMDIRIVDDHGKVLPDRRRGHLQFRGPSSLDSYYNNPEATRQVKDGDGWVKTGDLGYISEGELYLTGRSKDLIVVAGRNLHPEDIEDIVATIPGVRRGCVAAFGVSQNEEGTEALVVVAESKSFKDGPEKETLVKAISAAVTRQLGLAPDQVHVVAPHTVPKTPSGKIRRSETRQRLLEGRLRRSGGLAAQVVGLLRARAGKAARAVVEWPQKTARTVWCHTWLLGCVWVPQAVSLLSRKAALGMMRASARLYLKRAGVTVKVDSALGEIGPCLVVANHTSSLDPVILTAVFPQPVRFLVAPWIAEHPVFKNLIKRLGHLPVHRGDPEAAKAQEQEIARLLQGGDSSLAAFPEGGIEMTPGLRPFALGVFQVAMAVGVPVVPVAIRGARELQPWPRTEPYRGEISVVVGRPLTAEGQEWEHLVELAGRARAFIAEHCGDPLSNRRLRRND